MLQEGQIQHRTEKDRARIWMNAATHEKKTKKMKERETEAEEKKKTSLVKERVALLPLFRRQHQTYNTGKAWGIWDPR